MSKETPKDDPRDRTDRPAYKGTDEPWKKPGQASQNPGEKQFDIDLETWHRTNTH